MKKFFTLFALLSVGLSAWAQTYTLELLDETEEGVVFSSAMIYKEGSNGLYTLDKYVYLSGPNNGGDDWGEEGDDWEDPGYSDPTVYKFVVKNNNVQVSEMPYTIEEGRGGWYKLLFRYSTNRGLYYDEEYSEGPMYQLSFNDNLTIATVGASANVTYKRTGINQWGTIHLPFEFYTGNQQNVTFYELKSATSDALIFSPIDKYTWTYPAYPYIFKLQEGVTNLTIQNSEAEIVLRQFEQSTDDGSWTIHGTIEETTIANGWVMQNNKILQIDPNETAFPIKPYRCWFTGERPSGAPLRIEVDETEGLQFVEQEDGTVKVSYDLQGRKLDEARKGLMIENGKVIMVK